MPTDKKITGLPAATLPIASGVKFEAVQGGINVQVDADDMPGSGAAGVTSVSGTSNRITSTGGATPVIDIDAAYDAVVAAKAPIASPTFTGTPAAPTAGAGTNTTQLATTAFVQQEILSDTLVTFRRLTASHTLDATDLASINAGKTLIVEMNVGSANNLTVPLNSAQAFPLGTKLKISQYGGGLTTIAATGGVTLRLSAGVATLGGQYTSAILEKVDTDEWYVRNGEPTVISGTWTPTLTNTTNIAASTAYLCIYSRVGNTVHFGGRVDIDPTSTGNTVLGISLPDVSAFTTSDQAGGAAFSPGIAGQGAAILSDATNDRLTLQFIAVDTTNQAFYFSGIYQVL